MELSELEIVHRLNCHARASGAGGSALGLLFVVSSLLTGCGDPNTATPSAGAGATLQVSDAVNFTSVTDLTIQTVDVEAGADLNVCWGAMKKDIRCRAVPAAADLVKVVAFSEIKIAPSAVEPRIERGDLDTSKEIQAYFRKKGADAVASKCAVLSGMEVVQGPPAPVVPAVSLAVKASSTYLLTANSGEVLGAGALGLFYINPVVGAGVTTVNFDEDYCPALHFTASFSATPLPVPKAGPWSVNWAQITKDSQGVPYSSSVNGINKVQLGFFEGKTLAELNTSDGILHLEETATKLWEKTLAGKPKETTLGDLVLKQGGTPFSAEGFASTAGVWVLALSSSISQNPTPVVLTVLTPM